MSKSDKLYDKLEELAHWLDDGSSEGAILREHIENVLDSFEYDGLTRQEAVEHLFCSLEGLSDLIQYVKDRVEEILDTIN